MLVGLSAAELQALSAGVLVTPQQERLTTLLERNRAGQLNPDEARELDSLLERVDSMNTLKARARYTLHHLGLAA